jgi:hypothetical protein
MKMEKGDEVDFEGEAYIVIGIYPSSCFLKVKDGNKLFMTGLSFLETLYKKKEILHGNKEGEYIQK